MGDGESVANEGTGHMSSVNSLIVHFTVYTGLIQSGLYCTVSTVYCTLYCIVHSVHCIVYSEN